MTDTSPQPNAQDNQPNPGASASPNTLVGYLKRKFPKLFGPSWTDQLASEAVEYVTAMGDEVEKDFDAKYLDKYLLLSLSGVPHTGVVTKITHIEGSSPDFELELNEIVLSSEGLMATGVKLIARRDQIARKFYDSHNCYVFLMSAKPKPEKPKEDMGHTYGSLRERACAGFDRRIENHKRLERMKKVRSLAEQILVQRAAGSCITMCITSEMAERALEQAESIMDMVKAAQKAMP